MILWDKTIENFTLVSVINLNDFYVPKKNKKILCDELHKDYQFENRKITFAYK